MGKIKNVVTTGTCVALAGLMTMSLNGCKGILSDSSEPIISSDQISLTNDPLIDTIVVRINDLKDPVIVQKCLANEDPDGGLHYHFYDPITKATYVWQDQKCNDTNVTYVDHVTTVATVSSLLEPDVAVKLVNGTLTDDERAGAIQDVREKATVLIEQTEEAKKLSRK